MAASDWSSRSPPQCAARRRLVAAGAARRLAEEQNKRQRDKCQDHQQFEIVDIGDDLRLRRDGRIERGTPGLKHSEACPGLSR
jgi:hypothetical protein